MKESSEEQSTELPLPGEIGLSLALWAASWLILTAQYSGLEPEEMEDPGECSV